ncbi:transposase [Streptomyces globisporus]|uniref:Transposase IS701-like DDE domain-containing protein n=1 Tax=Streptomyces globisporus TaxID=1908 RepID=A0A423V2Y4_STRGL|nr:hypothetical protein D3105_08315 [Streptomyces globisporus]
MDRALSSVPPPRASDDRPVLAVDTCRLRPDAHTSPERILCHTYGRGNGPARSYSRTAVLDRPRAGAGAQLVDAPLDASRLAPGGDTAAVIARQLRGLIEQLTTTAQWQAGGPDVLVIADAGYDAPCLAYLLRDLPVQVLARMCSDRVLCRPAPPHRLTTTPGVVVVGQDGGGCRASCSSRALRRPGRPARTVLCARCACAGRIDAETSRLVSPLNRRSQGKRA